MSKRTYIYIDGFNLYYRCLKNTPNKWLDLKQLFCSILNSSHDIRKIKYFTTKVSGKFDANQPIRQETYIRAIEHYIPEVEVHYGHFLSSPIKAFSHHSSAPQRVKVDVLRGGGKKTIIAELLPDQLIEVLKTEEKGSDVKLAVHLLNDAWKDLYDCAIVVSNDSDLAEALKIVTNDKKKTIGILTPVDYPSKELTKYASFTRPIRQGVLSSCQLPNPIPGTTICKPSCW